MASAWAEQERSRGDLEDLLPNPELGTQPHSKTWEERMGYYDALKNELISSGHPRDIAEVYLSKLMSYHITGNHLLTIIWALQKARGHRKASSDPDLAVISDAWDRLPQAIRAGMVAMVRAMADS